MNKITFVIPSRNNLEFLQLAYRSIRDLETKHEILVLNDASTDNTQEWIDSQNDEDLIVHHNPGPERIGIVGMFDKGIEMARTDIICAFHSDMVVCKDFDKNILNHLKKGTVVSGTRVEPPLHPDGPEKIIRNYGIEVDEFTLDNWYKGSESLKEKKVTKGIFAPWCMYKEDFQAIGGHDKLFAPQSKEDSDLFNRFHLKGYDFVQPWDALVYHFTSRGSRFNKHSGGAAGKNSEEWLIQNQRSTRNFIRKWGHFIKHDEFMHPVVPNKYNIKIKVTNAKLSSLFNFEPWCSRIDVDLQEVMVKDYIKKEQVNTLVPIAKKINSGDECDIDIEIDGRTFTDQDYSYLQNISEILDESGSHGKFELGNLFISIKEYKQYTNELIQVYTKDLNYQTRLEKL